MRSRTTSKALLVAAVLAITVTVAACGPDPSPGPAAAAPAPGATPVATRNGCTAAEAATNTAAPTVVPLTTTEAAAAAVDAFATAPARLPDGSVPLVTVERVGDELVYTSTAVVTPEQATTTATAAAADGDLVAVEPDAPVTTAEAAGQVQTAAVSNDTYRAQQWGLNSAAFESAWPTTNGGGIVVGVVDTGVQANHPDLAGQVLPGYQFLHAGQTASSAAMSPSVDDNGHGTHVAGTIAAIANNAAGVTGAAPGVKILPIKALSANGAGWDSDIAAGISWATAHGATVINLSINASGPGLTDVAINDATAKGVLVFAAAGNSGAGAAPGYPAAGANAIAVASVDSSLARSTFSTTGSYVDIAAPGSAILSTSMNSGYSTMSGTSMATPYAAALGALVRARHPEWSGAQARERILTTATDLGTVGKDIETGCGFVDPVEATAT